MRLDTTIIFTQQMAKLTAFYQQGLAYSGAMNKSPGHIGFPLANGVYLGFDQVEDGDSLWLCL